MRNLFDNYIQSISLKFLRKETSELGYRTDFEILLKGIFEAINVKRIGHDDKAIEGKKPDFVVLSHDIPILYIEAKNIGESLDNVEKSEQMSRYYGYTNLILTDYLEFRFFRNGIYYCEPIKIANYDLNTRIISPLPEFYESIAKTIIDFTKSQKEPIKSGKHLSKIMGGKARRLRDNIRLFFSNESNKNADLNNLYSTIKKLLVHELTKDEFSDMYAQTLVYGLFVARYHDKSTDSFSRQEARELIPNSNPLLRHFFDHIVGADFDSRLKFIVDELCEVFAHANIEYLMKEYFKTDLWGEEHKEKDPVIHFYEDFLEEYDPVLRKEMGAYYTPPAIVSFITHAVDYILKQKFKLTSGLADTSKIVSGLHRVQILDPAVGTGTFISAVIRIIYETILKTGQKGRWPSYVHHDLLPRIYGFELMMTPYTIAHLKLGISFRQTGFWDFHRRLGIYLTNSLEESSDQQNLLALGLAESIAQESKEASVIKNQRPIMVVIGNPPYFGESSNKKYSGHNVYKFEPTGEKLKEKNSKWLNDDYVKFIRFAEHMIEKNGDGIVAMITAHGYIDNPTFRGMRWHILNTFDEIYILDLHGNANKKEHAPDGSEDKNVFDIRTGVAIFIGIKHKNIELKNIAKVFKADCFGSRSLKFNFLISKKLSDIEWKLITPLRPNYEFIIKDPKIEAEFQKGFSLNELFKLKNTGIVTKRDKLCIQFTSKEMWGVINDFINLSEPEVRNKYKLPDDVRDWKFEWAKKDILESGPNESFVKQIAYRPFDTRFIYYTGKARGFVGWPVERISKHYLFGNNIGLLVTKSHRDANFSHIFVTKNLSEVIFLSSTTASNAINLPLYLINDNGTFSTNLSTEIVNKLEGIIGKTKPEKILDYIYAFLYSPKYRQKFKDSLKRDFPYIPYPKIKQEFDELSKLGNELKLLHLLKSPKVEKLITTYEIDGENKIEKINYKNEKVYINNNQFFGGVKKDIWDFYIGGYQPVRKWLDYRKGRILSNSELEHFQKMIVAITETIKVMGKIDKELSSY